ncbi:unnamed protein product, partial [marine sediment metagenome]
MGGDAGIAILGLGLLYMLSKKNGVLPAGGWAPTPDINIIIEDSDVPAEEIGGNGNGGVPTITLPRVPTPRPTYVPPVIPPFVHVPYTPPVVYVPPVYPKRPPIVRVPTLPGFTPAEEGFGADEGFGAGGGGARNGRRP